VKHGFRKNDGIGSHLESLWHPRSDGMKKWHMEREAAQRYVQQVPIAERFQSYMKRLRPGCNIKVHLQNWITKHDETPDKDAAVQQVREYIQRLRVERS